MNKNNTRNNTRKKSRSKSRQSGGSSKKKTTTIKNKSKNHQTWEKFLKNKDSRTVLSKSWSARDPQKYYKNAIKTLSNKYDKTKNTRRVKKTRTTSRPKRR